MSILNFKQDRPMDLIGLGRLCIDLNANEILRPMEETLTFTKYVGGSPANIAVAAARLGLSAGFIGKVSDDAFGRYIVQYLLQAGIDTGGVTVDREGAVTGLAFTEIKSPTDCSILMYRDNVADLKLSPADIDEDYISRAKAMLISGTALAKSPSREAVFMALEYATKHDVVTFFDIDYRPYTWTSTLEAGIYARLAAEKCDCIFGGREEFDLLELAMGRPIVQDDDWTADHWLKHKARLIVVKRGGDGSKAYDRSGNIFHGSTFPAEVVKTFGAGDAFAGAFIYGIMQGWAIEKAQTFGAASASIVVSSHSCSDAMPMASQIQEKIDRWTSKKEIG